MRRIVVLGLTLLACGPDEGVDNGGGQTEGASGSSDESTGAEPMAQCAAPPLLDVDEIPEDPELESEAMDTVALFAVQGDQITGKFLRDAAVGDDAMLLWRELVTRVPLAQRSELGLFAIIPGSDPAGFLRRRPLGFLLSVTEDYLGESEDPCAPLAARRGGYDWTLIHEFGHLRSHADDFIEAFSDAFPGPSGPGEGYPEDGSPVLDRDFVTSYAERAGADEDAVESFTTFVMLDTLPPAADALATKKVRWFSDQSGYPELRRALRLE